MYIFLLSKYSGAHWKRYTYSEFSKTPFFSMAFLTLKELLHPWQSRSKEILTGGFRNGKTGPSTSWDIRAVVCQSLKDFIYYIEIEFSITSSFDIS